MGNLLNTKEIISTLITIIFFTIEAILHYNIGKTGNISFFHFPKMKEALKILFTIVIFATASTLVTHYIETLFIVN
jgi:tetrahydromethanopterin S-methyltransferase subunit D|tara:strand:+ start:169 stop:396 length:228 start_codon:yes stop_codon:yes gene_type:complete